MLSSNADSVSKTGALRLADVLRLFGFSQSTLRRRMDAGVVSRPMSPEGDRIKYWDAVAVWADYYRHTGLREEGDDVEVVL